MRDRAKPPSTNRHRDQVAERLRSLRSLLDPKSTSEGGAGDSPQAVRKPPKPTDPRSRIEPRITADGGSESAGDPPPMDDAIPVLTEVVQDGIVSESPTNDTVSRTFSELLDEFFESLAYDDDLESLDIVGRAAMERIDESVLATTGKPLLAEQRRRLRREIEDLLTAWATDYQQQLKQRLCQSFDE